MATLTIAGTMTYLQATQESTGRAESSTAAGSVGWLARVIAASKRGAVSP